MRKYLLAAILLAATFPAADLQAQIQPQPASMSSPSEPGLAGRPRRQGQVYILDFHSFLGSGKSSMDYAITEVAAQVDRILAAGYRFVSLADAIAGRIEGDANVAITIDDGNHSVLKAYREVFAPRGIHPDLFIYPTSVDKDRFTLSSAQLRELAAAGCGIGAHGQYHEYMSPIAYARDPAKVIIEAQRPGPALEKMIGTRPSLFAYPFGVHSPEAEEALQKAGYSWAFLAGDMLVPVDFSDPGLRRFAVPRTIVYRWNRETVLKALEARRKR